jgi:hypothetical protein
MVLPIIDDTPAPETPPVTGVTQVTRVAFIQTLRMRRESVTWLESGG